MNNQKILTDASQELLAHVQNAHAELKKRYALCLENNCKTIMEYNQKADNKLPQSLVIIPPAVRMG